MGIFENPQPQFEWLLFIKSPSYTVDLGEEIRNKTGTTQSLMTRRSIFIGTSTVKFRVCEGYLKMCLEGVFQ